MSPEVISFASHRWARLSGRAEGTTLTYGVGKICSSSCVFTTRARALLAKINWIEQGIEPHSQTLTGWPAVTSEQLEACRFEDAAERLVGRG